MLIYMKLYKYNLKYVRSLQQISRCNFKFILTSMFQLIKIFGTVPYFLEGLKGNEVRITSNASAVPATVNGTSLYYQTFRLGHWR